MSKETIEYSIERPIKGLIRSWALWAKRKPNIIVPVIYFRKPKSISDDAWVRIMENMKLGLPLGIEND